MTDPKMALQKLAARGITTLEQLVESKVRMRALQRIDPEKALEEQLAGSAAPPDPSYESTIAPPDSSVALVLDGKRVEYDAIARLKNQPLDYVATRLSGGEQALVIFSDRSIMSNAILRRLKGSSRTVEQEVANALVGGGLQPSSTVTPRGTERLEARIFEHIDWGGDSAAILPGTGQIDLSNFNDGLDFWEDWDNEISSIGIRNGFGHRCQLRAWENKRWGASMLLVESDIPNLHLIGWGDRISSLWCDFIPG
jgi:hypothetical protein